MHRDPPNSGPAIFFNAVCQLSYFNILQIKKKTMQIIVKIAQKVRKRIPISTPLISQLEWKNLG